MLTHSLINLNLLNLLPLFFQMILEISLVYIVTANWLIDALKLQYNCNSCYFVVYCIS